MQSFALKTTIEGKTLGEIYWSFIGSFNGSSLGVYYEFTGG